MMQWAGRHLRTGRRSHKGAGAQWGCAPPEERWLNAPATVAQAHCRAQQTPSAAQPGQAGPSTAWRSAAHRHGQRLDLLAVAQVCVVLGDRLARLHERMRSRMTSCMRPPRMRPPRMRQPCMHRDPRFRGQHSQKLPARQRSWTPHWLPLRNTAEALQPQSCLARPSSYSGLSASRARARAQPRELMGAPRGSAPAPRSAAWQRQCTS